MQTSLVIAKRYDRFSRLLHWVVAAVIIYAMCMGYILHALEGTRWFTFFSVLNMSLGTIATPIMMVRFVWRFFRPSVPYPATVAGRKKQLVVFIHELFYLTIMVVLVSGFLMLQKDYNLFGLVPVSRPIAIAEVNAFFFQMHRYSCILLGVILLGHVAAVLKYTFSGQREILQRML
ncbi:cytochrome b/b6 domain-containing protein [Enterobacter bugandensis]|uniref:cytochrome b n=1 Tax=Enterobacter bugandensis TaxID=881260 RepID=UPI002B2010A8|nr:cytochrome b/b6 domain-containing protein [Enterobacter bugandensis]MEA5166608.1 cytochrome b/b6 domain-containing protein [Enterobacter bugandensis]